MKDSGNPAANRLKRSNNMSLYSDKKDSFFDPTPPGQPEDAALEKAVQHELDEWDADFQNKEQALCAIMQLFREHEQKKVQAARKDIAREAVHDKLKSLAQAGNEFGRKTGSVEAGWAHIRDLIQAEPTQPPAADTTKQGEGE